MKKLIILLILFKSVLFADYNNFDFKYSTSELSKYSIYKEMEEELKISKFEKMKIFENFGNSENFKRGWYAMTNKDTRIFKGLGLAVPNYIDGINLILKDSNILSSYTAYKLLEMNFLVEGNIFTKKVLRKATKELYKHKFTLGMLWHAKSYKRGWSNGSFNYPKCLSILEETKELILKIKKKRRTYTEELALNGVYHEIAKTKAIIALKNRIESGNMMTVKRHIKGLSK